MSEATIDNVTDALLIINQKEEAHLQSGNINSQDPPPTDPPQAPSDSTKKTYQRTLPPVLTFGQQEVQPTLFEQLTKLPSLPPAADSFTLQLPPTDTQGSAPAATVAGSSLLPVDLSELLATLQKATRHLVLLPKAHLSPTEEVTRDHSTAELVSGQCLSVPTGLLVDSGDGLVFGRTAASDSIEREDC